ncbi:hypothetical protein ILUMI_12177 [Ignelater luminosus]|uniref:Osiris 19 n=1 Tax=Ignelater luminosus TaxID=2038154 RepID=A0A8K0GC20_IGNLU|nr:hypothetical protein ILUMI_12177 [Ignelater luminosus]
MAFTQVCFVLVLVTFAASTPTSKPAFWKGTAFDTTVEEMRALCANEDAIACLKYKFMSVLDSFFKKDSFQITENVEVTRNSFRGNEVSGRSDASLEENIQEYLQSHDVTFKFPVEGSSVTVGARNLDQDELDLKFRFSESGNGVQEARKSKLKKIIIPIFIFILLKAITLIPLALGVLGLKAWNALQLSFFSFVVSIALAVFQLCKKIAADGHPQIAAHGPWDAAYSTHYARSFDAQPSNALNEEEAQKMAYSAYV